MRVLQLHTRYRQAGGEDMVVAAERAALEGAGHEVHAHIEENPEGPLAASGALLGSLWNPRSARRLVDAVDATRPDVAHVHNTWFATSPSVLSVLRRRRVPVVMTLHNYRLVCANAMFLRDGAPCEKRLTARPGLRCSTGVTEAAERRRRSPRPESPYTGDSAPGRGLWIAS